MTEDDDGQPETEYDEEDEGLLDMDFMSWAMPLNNIYQEGLRKGEIP